MRQDRLLDISDAFARECGAASDHAVRDKFYLEVPERGLHGSIRRGANLLGASHELSRLAENLRVEVDKFLLGVRAGC